MSTSYQFTGTHFPFAVLFLLQKDLLFPRKKRYHMSTRNWSFTLFNKGNTYIFLGRLTLLSVRSFKLLWIVNRHLFPYSCLWAATPGKWLIWICQLIPQDLHSMISLKENRTVSECGPLTSMESVSHPCPANQSLLEQNSVIISLLCTTLMMEEEMCYKANVWIPPRPPRYLL